MFQAPDVPQWRLSGDTLPDEHPEAEHVTGLISGVTNQLLRCHVVVKNLEMADGIANIFATFDTLWIFEVTNLEDQEKEQNIAKYGCAEMKRKINLKIIWNIVQLSFVSLDLIRKVYLFVNV